MFNDLLTMRGNGATTHHHHVAMETMTSDGVSRLTAPVYETFSVVFFCRRRRRFWFWLMAVRRLHVTCCSVTRVIVKRCRHSPRVKPNTHRRHDWTVASRRRVRNSQLVGDSLWTNLPTTKSSCVVLATWTYQSAVVIQFTISCTVGSDGHQLLQK